MNRPAEMKRLKTSGAPLRANIFRVLVASPPRDWPAHRSALFNDIFPALDRLCQSRGIVFLFSDTAFGWLDADQEKNSARYQAVELGTISDILRRAQSRDRFDEEEADLSCRRCLIGLLSRNSTQSAGRRLNLSGYPDPFFGKRDFGHDHRDIIKNLLDAPDAIQDALFYICPPNSESTRKATHGVSQRIRRRGFPVRDMDADAKAFGNRVYTDLTALLDAIYPPSDFTSAPADALDASSAPTWPPPDPSRRKPLRPDQLYNLAEDYSRQALKQMGKAQQLAPADPLFQPPYYGLKEAMDLASRQSAIYRQLGDWHRLSLSLFLQAAIMSSASMPLAALEALAEGAFICRKLGDLDGLQKSLGGQAALFTTKRKPQLALECYRQQDALGREISNTEPLPLCRKPKRECDGSGKDKTMTYDDQNEATKAGDTRETEDTLDGHIPLHGDASYKTCRRLVHDMAIKVAGRILAGRGIAFSVAQSPKEANDNEEGPFREFVRSEDLLGAAACLLQNCRFLLGPDSATEQAQRYSKALCNIGDHYFYDGVDTNDALDCYKLAVGLNPWNLSALYEATGVCLQGEIFQPAIALPYAYLRGVILPEKNEVAYIMTQVMRGAGGITAEAMRHRLEKPAAEAHWPTAGGHASRTGVAAGTVEFPLAPSWTVESGGVKSGIAVSGNTAVFGNRAGMVYAVDTPSGNVRWRQHLEGVIDGAPAIWSDHVYLGNSATACCLDLATGAVCWKTETGLLMADWVNLPAPTLANVHCVLCIYGLAVFCDDYLTIFNAETGTLMLGMPLGLDAGSHAGACANSELIFIAGHKKIVCLNPWLNGKTWTFPLPYKVMSGPVVAGELLLYGSGNATLEAIRIQDGAPAWSFAMEGNIERRGLVNCRPATDLNRVYFGGPDGFFYALDLQNGRKIWSRHLGGEIDSPPVICGQSVIASAPRASLCALSTEDGRLLWELEKGALGDTAGCHIAPCRGGLLAGGRALYGLRTKA